MHKKRLSKDEQEWILANFKKYNIIEKAKKEAFVLVEEAISLMRNAGEHSLEAIATKMVDRSF